MKVYEIIAICVVSLCCLLAWAVVKLPTQIKDYFYNLFHPGSKPYKFWVNVGKFIIGIACMFFIWAIFFHLMK